MQKTLNKILIGLFLFVGVFLFGNNASADWEQLLNNEYGTMSGMSESIFQPLGHLTGGILTVDFYFLHTYTGGGDQRYAHMFMYEKTTSDYLTTETSSADNNRIDFFSSASCPTGTWDYRVHYATPNVKTLVHFAPTYFRRQSGSNTSCRPLSELTFDSNKYYFLAVWTDYYSTQVYGTTTNAISAGDAFRISGGSYYDVSGIADIYYHMDTPSDLPADGTIDFTSPLVDFPYSPQIVNFSGTYQDYAIGYNAINFYVLDDITGNVFFNQRAITPDCSGTGVCAFSFNILFYGGNYSYTAKMSAGGVEGLSQENPNWTFMIPADGEIVSNSSITISTPLENDNLPVGDTLFKGNVINGDQWLIDYPAYDTLLLRIFNKDNNTNTTDTLPIPPSDNNTSFSFNVNLISGNYAYSLWAYDPIQNILHANLSSGSINFTVGQIDVGGGTLPTDYCDWDFEIFGYNTALLSTVCKMIVPAPNSISAIFQNYITDLKNTFPAVVEFYSAMNNGFDSLSSSSTATPSFADVEMPVGGNDTVAVQFIDFSQISGYMATFRGWMSIFIWFSVIWLCYERVIGLFNPNFKPTPPMSANTINLSKGERIN